MKKYVSHFLELDLNEKYYFFRLIYYRIKVLLFYKFFFKKIGKFSAICKPLKINGIRNISVGERVIVEEGTWLAAINYSNAEVNLEIGNGTAIGHYCHIYATENVSIADHVLIADKVYISDNLHDFKNIEVPIIHQPIKQLSRTSIGRGSWIGENVAIMGCNIGENCVIGANSVVTKDIPDYSVAVGAPARIIKRYCQIDQTWKRTTKNGDFYE